MKMCVNLGEDSYDIVVKRGILKEIDKEINLQRKVFIITDKGVPSEYSNLVASKCLKPHIAVVETGEESKSLNVYEKLLSKMLSLGFDRGDCVVAVGGGVVGDLSGFVASSYMRGIDFYNIPTTVLSQIDSSIGGKVAVNLDGIKNIVGAFYQPKKVVIDPEVLKTLPKRQISNGLSEAVKMSLTSSEELFEIFENKDPLKSIDEIIIKSLNIKKNVVEKDEKEAGLRKILNFGHSIGHAIESRDNANSYYHGECVALGMIPMCSDEVRVRLIKVLEKLSLPVKTSFNPDKIIDAMTHDKKVKGGFITAVFVKKAGEFEMREVSPESLKESLALILEEV